MIPRVIHVHFDYGPLEELIARFPLWLIRVWHPLMIDESEFGDLEEAVLGCYGGVFIVDNHLLPRTLPLTPFVGAGIRASHPFEVHYGLWRAGKVEFIGERSILSDYSNQDCQVNG